MENNEIIIFRAPVEDDKAFIFNSWLKSYRDSEFAKHMCNPVYFDNHKALIENLIRKSYVAIACNSTDPNQIYGYVVFERNDDVTILHYLYVKFPYRKFGIGKKLFAVAQPDPTAFSLMSHMPHNCDGFSKKYNLIYDVYRLV